MDGKEFAEQYRDRGYFIVDDAVEPDLLDLLEAAARRVVDKIRSGAVVDDEAGMRTGGEGVEPQFVSGLIAPEFGESVFAEYLDNRLFSPEPINPIGDIIQNSFHLILGRSPYNARLE